MMVEHNRVDGQGDVGDVGVRRGRGGRPVRRYEVLWLKRTEFERAERRRGLGYDLN